MFWSIPVIPYSSKSEGVIKKQIKFNSLNESELLAMREMLKKELQYDEHIIKSINNPDGRIKFKDVRKLSVGMSKKDITHACAKKKSAFYNCLVLILRLKIDGVFREFHVKIFNTGKMELPGMQIESTKILVLSKIIEIIQPHLVAPVAYLSNGYTILINSNFNCGFYINRESLCSILKTKYNIETIYDICSYPGIQCKLYYDSEVGICFKNTKPELIKVSFMIFRTGSILIVGMINEEALHSVYDYIKNLLQVEYRQIGQKIPTCDAGAKLCKTPRKKVVTITVLKRDQPSLFHESCEMV
jgi:TATA-box binding protein (TBP) (component of TFIID and TFIIIB)